MDGFFDRLDQARERLAAKDEVRDTMLDQRRSLVSGARTVVNLVHQDRTGDALDRFEHVLEEVEPIRSGLSEHPDLWWSGALRNALQEVAEAWALLRLVGEDATLPENLVTDEALVLGLADTVGELRRLALDALIEDRVDDAVDRLRQMERLYEALRAIDVSSGVVDHRHKTDVARQLIDKTRGKIALGKIERRIQAAAGSDQPGLDPSRRMHDG